MKKYQYKYEVEALSKLILIDDDEKIKTEVTMRSEILHRSIKLLDISCKSCQTHQKCSAKGHNLQF